MTKNLTFEINPNHEVIVKLNRIRKSHPVLASTLAKQLLDNCMLSSGLLRDPKPLIDRIYNLMTLTMDAQEGKLPGPAEEHPEPEREVEEDDSILNKKN